MKVTIKNNEIVNAVDPLRKLMNEKMPVKVSYGIAKLISKLNEPLKIVDETRTSLVKKYCEQDGGGQTIVKPGSDNFEKFSSELSELLNQEVEVTFDKVKLPEKVAATCDKCNHNMDKEFEIEPLVLLALDKFIEV